MYPVFGTPTGSGVCSSGAIAMQTPTPTAGETAQRRGTAHSRRRRCHRDPRLWRDRQRKSQRAFVPSCAGDGLDRRAHRLCDRLARGDGHPGRHPDDHPAHAVRLQPDGLHHQPRQPVCADLLDRHPGRRRDRGGREHRPPLGDERRPPAHAGHDRSGRRGRQSDRRRDPDRGCRAVADAVRVGVDGPLHGADPGQCVGGDAVLILRRHGGRALADAAAAPAGKLAARARGRTAKVLLAASTAALPRRSCARGVRLGCS